MCDICRCALGSELWPNCRRTAWRSAAARWERLPKCTCSRARSGRLQRRVQAADDRSERGRVSLAGRRLPQLDLVPLRVDDPAELPILGVIGLLKHLATLVP